VWSASAALLLVVSTAQLLGTGVVEMLTSPTLSSLLWEVRLLVYAAHVHASATLFADLWFSGWRVTGS
jgi:hypothetical protein